MTVENIQKFQYGVLMAQYVKDRAMANAEASLEKLVSGLGFNDDQKPFLEHAKASGEQGLRFLASEYGKMYHSAFVSTPFSTLWSLYSPLLTDYLLPEQVGKVKAEFDKYGSKSVKDYEKANHKIVGYTEEYEQGSEEDKKRAELEAENLEKISTIAQSLEGMRLNTLKPAIDREANKKMLEQLVKNL